MIRIICTLLGSMQRRSNQRRVREAAARRQARNAAFLGRRQGEPTQSGSIDGGGGDDGTKD